MRLYRMSAASLPYRIAAIPVNLTLTPCAPPWAGTSTEQLDVSARPDAASRNPRKSCIRGHTDDPSESALRLSKLTLGLIVALAAAPAFAQSTSAGVGGIVTGASGQPVAGAEVTITHVESGTVSRATTDASGRYDARGLRVGGPYTITITSSAAGNKTEEGVYLDLNKVNAVNAQAGR